MRIVIAALVLLMLAGAAMADVRNVNLVSVGDSGLTGTATTIAARYGGATPHTHVEVNARLSRTPSANMVYEAWLVDNESSAKHSLGVVRGSMLHVNSTMTSFKAGMPWDAIAISIEPADDTDPMPAKIVAQGNLPGSMVSSADFATMAVLPADEMFQGQLIMQRWNLTQDQCVALRMDGLMYREINLVSNIASRCNRSPIQVASEYMTSGGDLTQIASTCNTTVSQLLTPMPMVTVAGSIEEFTPGTTMMAPSYYLTRPNGALVVTREQWMRYKDSGYTWRQVAIAANIAQRTGMSVGDILRMNKIQGLTFSQIALDHNIRPTVVMDVSAWPWERDGGMETMEPVMRAPATSTPMPSSPDDETSNYNY